MALNKRFELHKIKRTIKRNPTTLTFWRFRDNEFGERDFEKPPQFLCSIIGMYHEFTAHMSDTYVVLTSIETSITRTNKAPQCLCEYDDVVFKNKKGESDSIKVGDYVYYNYRVMRVAGLQNIMEWNMLVDISFEEVDDGTDTYIRREQEHYQDQSYFCK